MTHVLVRTRLTQRLCGEPASGKGVPSANGFMMVL
jgi:hypothetical protein